MKLKYLVWGKSEKVPQKRCFSEWTLTGRVSADRGGKKSIWGEEAPVPVSRTTSRRKRRKQHVAWFEDYTGIAGIM